MYIGSLFSFFLFGTDLVERVRSVDDRMSTHFFFIILRVSDRLHGNSSAAYFSLPGGSGHSKGSC